MPSTREKQVALFKEVLSACENVLATATHENKEKAVDGLLKDLCVGNCGALAHPGTVLTLKDMDVMKSFVKTHGIKKFLFVGAGAAAV